MSGMEKLNTASQNAVRNKALSNLDIDWARRMMPDASNDHIRILAMHKARYECTQIAKDLRLISGEWLRKRGYERMYGGEILPEGELPE